MATQGVQPPIFQFNCFEHSDVRIEAITSKEGVKILIGTWWVGPDIRVILPEPGGAAFAASRGLFVAVHLPLPGQFRRSFLTWDKDGDNHSVNLGFTSRQRRWCKGDIQVTGGRSTAFNIQNTIYDLPNLLVFRLADQNFAYASVWLYLCLLQMQAGIFTDEMEEAQAQANYLWPNEIAPLVNTF